MSFRLKRIYDKPSRSDGFRVLVDRVWPRGISKDEAKLDRWLKDLAPSDGLRKWFGHDSKKWSGFKEKYFRELDRHPTRVQELARIAKRRRITLLFGAKDRVFNNAVALKEYLDAAG